MSTSQTAQVSDAMPPLSEVSRIADVFANPKRAFADIVVRPRWYVPVVLWVIIGLCFVVLFTQRVGFERMLQQSFDQSPRTQNMTAEQREKSMQVGLAVAKPMAFASAIAGPPLTVLVVAAVLMLIANSLLGTQITFPQMCAITAYSCLTYLVSTALAIVVMFIRSPDEFDLKNPLAFNIGAFLNADTAPKWLVSLCTSLDVFSFWTIALIAIGIMATSRKMTFGKAAVAVLIPWAVVVLLKSAAAGFMS
jgi:hypothetical protein